MLFQRIFKTLATLLDVLITAPTDGQFFQYNASAAKWINATLVLNASDISAGTLANARLANLIEIKGCQLDGAGFPIANGSIASVQIPYNCTVVGWSVISTLNVSGNITFDVQTATQGSLTPNAAGTSIVGSGTKPALAASVKTTSSSLTSWSPNLNAGDYLIFQTSGVSAITQARIEIRIQPR